MPLAALAMVKNSVRVPDFLQIDVAVGRIDIPTAVNEAQRERTAGTGIANVVTGLDGACAIGQHIMAINIAPGGNGDIAGLRAKSSRAGIRTVGAVESGNMKLVDITPGINVDIAPVRRADSVCSR